MNLKRLGKVYGLELKHNLTRPLFWVFLVIVVALAYGLSSGQVRISAGDSSVGGRKVWITSEYAVTQLLTLVVLLFYSFFVAVAAGLCVIQDDELKVGHVLHATPLKPSEYIWGKFLAVLTSFAGILLIHLMATAFFTHLVPNANTQELRGPFNPIHYLRPGLLVAFPTIFFVAALSFATGVLTRKPILVFFLPVAVILVCGFFLWEWSPFWLDPRINKLFMVLDPAGYRWLEQTWLKVDRGVDFYNLQPMGYDTIFWVNRLWLVVAGLGGMFLALNRFEATLRGTSAAPAAAGGRKSRGVRAMAADDGAPPETGAARLAPHGLRALRMSTSPVGFLAGAFTVMRAELRELLNQPGLYLFVPLIMLQTLGTTLVAQGAFDTPLLFTPGILAVRAMNTVTLLVCLLLLFYTVESQERERSSGLSPIYLSTPLKSASMLFGKALANSMVGVVILLATFLACVVALLIQGRVGLDVRPFLLVWGLLLVPTFILWTSFVTATLALVRNRYTTYAIGLGALIFTGVRQMIGKMNWAGNWDLWSFGQWSDMGGFDMNGQAILLNRLFALSLAAFFTVLTVRYFARRELDSVRLGHRLSPGTLLKGSLPLLPWAVAPITLAVMLVVMVHNGFQGKAAEKRERDYWRKNLATWHEAPQPALARVDVTVDLEPAQRGLKVKGTYRLRNILDRPLRQLALTPGLHFTKIDWTMGGKEYKPVDRSGLYVFTPEQPLAPGDSLEVGFSYAGHYPRGVTKNGGGQMEFILKSGVVLTSFSGAFVPEIGWDESIGMPTRENTVESREYADDYYREEVPSFIGTNGGIPYDVHVTISGPADYTYNSVGTRVSDTVTGQRRTTVWQTEHPVSFFNIVAGQWAVKEGKNDTVIYYHPEHKYNIEAMSRALDAARVNYSAWFAPYPWKTLKLSEFPAYANYAQGFPTNITFSESIGFLTKDDPRAAVAFLVTAHESAHQWWGNILSPGKGPGGDILSEGMSHYSSGLLLEKVEGLRARIEFFKKIEEAYGNTRQVDSERPLVKIDNTRDGDKTVTYDKGGWVPWMLTQEMGREPALAGMRDFIAQYANNPDHPLLQDFLRVMRTHAPDTTAFDAFERQWYYEVVVPEYRLTDAKVVAAGADSSWNVTFTVQNVGTGTMPLELAATRGERWPDAKKSPPGADGRGDAARSTLAAVGDAAAGGANLAVPPAGAGEAPNYREARQTITLGAGEKQTLTIHCAGFKPDKVLADPDALVLQLRRKNALIRL